MTRLSNLAGRAHQVVLAEQIARTHTQLAAHHLLIQPVVAVDDHLINTCLLALIHAHLQVDGVALDARLDGDKLVEEVAIVHIQVGDSIVILLCALVEQFLVVDIALADAQHFVEHGGRIDGVAHPRHTVDVVFLALVDGDVNVDRLVVVVDHTVGHDDRIAVALLVILVDDALLVVLIVRAHKLLLAEELEQVAFLIGLLHRALDLAVAQHLVAGDVNLVHLDFVVLVHHDVDHHRVLVAQVLALHDSTLGLLKTLVGKVLLDQLLDAVGDVGCHLAALHQTQPLLDFLLLAALHALVGDCRHSRLLPQVEGQPSAVFVDLVDLDLDFAEQPLSPEALGH